MAKQKTEMETYQQKADFYHAKKVLLEDRIELLKGKLADPNEDRLKVNGYKMEILDHEASLEGINSYWSHYMERILAIEQRDSVLTKEREENFKRLYDIFTSVSPANLKTYSAQIQERYNNVIAEIDKEHPDAEKNALYLLMKDLLQIMRKI